MGNKDLNTEEQELKNQQEEQTVETTEETTAETTEETVENAEETVEAVEEPVKKTAEEELAEMKDKYLRLYAEFDNYRKRTIKERQELLKTAASSTIQILLPVLDDFERAIQNEDNIPEGIVLTYNKLFKTLEQKGLKKMESKNTPFDPEMHEAITKIPAPTEELKGKVVDTIEEGYYLNEKIIRYAKVVVGQ